jgi:hypothetical protein
MGNSKWLRRVLLAIAAATVLSGLVQALLPRFVLGIIGGEATPGGAHSFGIVGMFMVLFGGMLMHALLTPGDHRIAVLWSGLQKLGAFAAVSLGVARGLFSVLALGVAGFDLLSGVLILLYLRGMRPAPPAPAVRPPARRVAEPV